METLGSILVALFLTAAILGSIGSLIAIILVAFNAPASEFAEAYRLLNYLGYRNNGQASVVWTGLLSFACSMCLWVLHVERTETTFLALVGFAIFFFLFTGLSIAEFFLRKRLKSTKNVWQKPKTNRSPFV